MENNIIYLLWDSSHIWGLMAMRAMRHLGVPCRLVKSKEIAQGALLGKGGAPAALMAPGGNARLKAAALGGAGMESIRSWLKAGGVYFGFCGGAGLALTPDKTGQGLGICPWTRAGYSQRLYHLLSGHLLARLHAGGEELLPVWWPGRFAPITRTDICIEAAFIKEGADLWLADLPIAKVPANVLKISQRRYGLDPGLGFPSGQPLAISGRYGAGSYFLSYAHLETPDSPGANLWLCSLLKKFCGISPPNQIIPPWPVNTANCPIPAAFDGGDEENFHQNLLNLALLAENLGLFFKRTPWLWGWRAGMPGMGLNNILAACSILREISLNGAALELWRGHSREISALMADFINGSRDFFWLSRMEKTINGDTGKPSPELARQASRLFGHPMLGGGLAGRILDFLEEIIFLAHNGQSA